MAVVDYPRFAEKFENSGGSVTQTFPTRLYEWESSQDLRTPSASLTGAHYDLDLLGSVIGLKASARERLRFVISNLTVATIETDFDTLKQKIYSIGQGKLYVINSAGSARRWAWARPTILPSSIIQVGQPRILTVSALEFRRDSDWYDTTITNEGEVLNADPDTVVISNAGNAPVFNAIITLKGTFTNPSITSSTTGFSFSSTRDGSAAAHWLKIDCGRGTVEFSTDSGATYADDMPNFTRGASQVGFMRIDPGDNSWVITGANGATLACDFYGAYH